MTLNPDKLPWIRRVSRTRDPSEIDTHIALLFIERFFKIRERSTTVNNEVYCGIIHFISAAFILSVNASLLSSHAGYSPSRVSASTALSTGVASILCGILANLPFILAPTTSTSLYFALFMENHKMSVMEGNLSIFFLAVVYTLCAFRPIAVFLTHAIPFVMKVGVCLGVGLLIALEALFEVDIVERGRTTVLDIGQFTPKSYIAMLSFVVIGLALHFELKGAFLIGITCGTVLYWISQATTSTASGSQATNKNNIFTHPEDIVFGFRDIAWDEIYFFTPTSSASSAPTEGATAVHRLVFDLFVVCIILMNGLAQGLADSAGLTREDFSIPRGKWLYASCGLGTMFSAFMGSGPILISPETAPGIKAGARTGFSSVVCGCLFLLSSAFCPVFAAVPKSGTSPVLLMIGLFMFENAGRVEWSLIREALPVFIIVIFIPFTYSILNGVIFGFGMHVILLVATEGGAFKQLLSRNIESLGALLFSLYVLISNGFKNQHWASVGAFFDDVVQSPSKYYSRAAATEEYSGDDGDDVDALSFGDPAAAGVRSIPSISTAGLGVYQSDPIKMSSSDEGTEYAMRIDSGPVESTHEEDTNEMYDYFDVEDNANKTRSSLSRPERSGEMDVWGSSKKLTFGLSGLPDRRPSELIVSGVPNITARARSVSGAVAPRRLSPSDGSLGGSRHELRVSRDLPDTRMRSVSCLPAPRSLSRHQNITSHLTPDRKATPTSDHATVLNEDSIQEHRETKVDSTK